MTQIKERPILFGPDMVRSILAGTKTQTRRVVKPQPIIDNDSGLVFDGKHREAYKNDLFHADWQEKFAMDWCPYGQPGERLWVRETLYFDTCGEEWCYQADNNPVDAEYNGILAKQKGAVSSIHMPRVACRILLEVVSVRLERLQAISDEDAIAEGVEQATAEWAISQGCEGYEKDWYRDYSDPTYDYFLSCINPAKQSYYTLWQKLNGEGSIAKNPWVWVVEFKRIEL